MGLDWAGMADSTLKVVLAGLVFGAGLPLLFAVGVRLWSAGNGSADTGAGGTVTRSRSIPATTAAYIVFAVIIAIVAVAVLWITKTTLGHYFGWNPFGATS
jgi:hypothetical protein